MSSISFEYWATDPQGKNHTLAKGDCKQCKTVKAVNTPFTCTQGAADGQNCAGMFFSDGLEDSRPRYRRRIG